MKRLYEIDEGRQRGKLLSLAWVVRAEPWERRREAGHDPVQPRGFYVG